MIFNKPPKRDCFWQFQAIQQNPFARRSNGEDLVAVFRHVVAVGDRIAPSEGICYPDTRVLSEADMRGLVERKDKPARPDLAYTTEQQVSLNLCRAGLRPAEFNRAAEAFAQRTADTRPERSAAIIPLVPVPSLKAA